MPDVCLTVDVTARYEPDKINLGGISARYLTSEKQNDRTTGFVVPVSSKQQSAPQYFREFK